MQKRIALFVMRLAFACILIGLLAALVGPQQMALAADRDTNARITITAEPDSTGVNIIVYVQNLKDQSLGFDVRISIPAGVKLERSWAGNPNSNPGKNTGIDVGWITSLATKGTQGPFVARLISDAPFTTRARASYTGASSGSLQTADLTTTSTGGLELPPAWTGATVGISLISLHPLNNFAGLVDVATLGPAGRLDSLDADVMPAQIKPGSGLLITMVDPQGAAGLAGIKIGDILISIDGNPVYDVGSWQLNYSVMPVGETVKLEVRRGTQLLSFSMQTQESTNASYDRAIAYQQQLIENEPDNILPLLDYVYYILRNDPDTRIEVLTELIEQHPNASILYSMRAESYQRLDELELSRADFEMAVQVNPYDTFALLNLAAYEADEDNIETYLEYTQRTLKKHPNNHYALLNLASYEFLVNSDFDAAFEYAAQALESNPYYAWTYFVLADLYAASGEFEQARIYLRIAIAVATSESQRKQFLESYQNLVGK